MLEQIQNEMKYSDENENAMKANEKVKMFCRTRWTVRAASLKSILNNYKYLLQLLPRAYNDCTDTEMKARLNGVLFKMNQFDFFMAFTCVY